ncbi:von Willebrand factor type A domain protein [Ancylostoma caninum]|uniref:von Willebrand factor type A domain protein n=1 Tax=Ancylostoma caninum TaxID=29170 RepID=A0A368FT45_ANCCA|nr:von Willebrand factor type A domain protein [Ancylostoma caninum]
MHRDVVVERCYPIYGVLQGLTISPNADRVGVIVYSSSNKQKEKIPLGSINDPAELTKAVQGLPFLSGTTATGAALGFAEQALRNRREHVHTIVIVITDGFSFDSPDRYAAQLRNYPNTVVLAVSMGHVFLRRELEKITGSADTVLFGPTSYGQLVKLIKTCENENTKQENQDQNEGSATLRTYDTTDNLGRYLVSIPPVPEYSGAEASGESNYESMSGMLSYAFGGELKDNPQMDGSFSTDDLTAQNIDSFSDSSLVLLLSSNVVR